MPGKDGTLGDVPQTDHAPLPSKLHRSHSGRSHQALVQPSGAAGRPIQKNRYARHVMLAMTSLGEI
ncbi:hypothetical protein IE4872_PD02000 (plasmid) [Rhizobium gallicum]|uniref:Uncharacterized protein n=1 Tax=Rhizobium gallicum TaxID=56730 RepID=A0A1L5NXC7_9HYPH|nr:hypothetical protein IE4872_PD02000 [Rhizobium gallicum]